MRGWRWLLGVGWVSAATVAVLAQARVPTTPLDLFLLAGQSNMAGRGVIEDEDRVPPARVWTLDKDERWRPATDPLHFDKPIAAVGPGRAFGIAVAAAKPGVEIGLVPVAVGGSSVVAWQPGAVHAETGAHPWDDAIRRIKVAKSSGTFRAVLWHQGEADTTPAAAALYEGRLRDLIGRLRSELGDPALPFLIGQLGRFPGRTWSASYEQIDAIHQRLAGTLPSVRFVSAADLTDRGDALHFDAPSARTLGQRFAAAYLSVRQ